MLLIRTNYGFLCIYYTSPQPEVNCTVVYINYHVKTSISYVPYPNSYLIMELFILFGGFYALYVVGNAIAATLDYRAVNKTRRYK